MVVIALKRAAGDARSEFHQFPRTNARFLLRPLAAVLALCTLGSTLFLFAACSTQNTNVTPSPGIWKIVHSPNPGSAQNNLIAIAATSVTDAWAVGSFSNNHFNLGAKALIEHWNGSAWRVVASPAAPLGDSNLSGVAAISPTDAWAVGSTYNDSNSNVTQPLIEHWNGSAWATVASPTVANGAHLSAVTALSATDIWAVGSGNNPKQSLIEHWDGTVWKTIHSPNPGSGFDLLTGLAAVSTNDVWAVGIFSNENNGIEIGEELFEHWNGTSWTVVQGQNAGVQGNTLSAIAAVSTRDVWAIGSSNNNSPVTDTLIEQWNGTSWSTIKGQNPGNESNTLSAIVALSARDIWAVGSSSNAASNNTSNQQAQPLIEHWNGSIWSTVASPNIGTNNTTLTAAGLVPQSTKIWAVGIGATYGDPVSVSSPNATQTSYVTPITAQTLIESCCP